MMLRHLKALFHRERCDRKILIPMLDKLSETERMALWRLLQNIQADAKPRRGSQYSWFSRK